jgi:hypothetical protein
MVRLLAFTLGAALVVPIPSLTAGEPNARQWSKLHPKLRLELGYRLREPVPHGPDDQGYEKREHEVAVQVRAGTNLEGLLGNAVTRRYIDPLGLQLVIGRVGPGDIEKLVGLDSVIEVWPASDLIEPPLPPDPDIPRRSRERLNQRETEAKDWYESTDVHRFRQAWDRGFTGRGVKVMINDSGIDFCHPDLHGTWATVEDQSSPYFGWPLMFDAYSMYLLARDLGLGERNLEEGRAHYADTSSTCEEGSTCRFTPIGTSRIFHYTLPGTSLSGVYRIGSHPDTTLDRTDGRAAILLADEEVAGVYDTVYVDMNQNRDFTDDPAASRASPAACGSYEFGTYSGGLVYFIADGVNPVPGSDWMWGLGPPAAGDLVAFAIDDVNEFGNGHGTKCASAVAAQGVVNGGAPSFKPPYQGPGDGMVLGAGRDAKLVAVGNTFLYPGLAEPFLLAALGIDGEPNTSDDVQIVTNSWGSSTVDNDGWDLSSRMLDSIQRQLGPKLSIVFSAGNGGPGYGTVAPPAPPGAVMVGASTEMGSTGWDGIASAEQIRWGDVVPFSSRGPTARGEVGVHVVAVGAFAAGDLTVNESSDDVESAWLAWGGTSRACPIAGGNLTLVYDAYRQTHGVWPDFEIARAILMAGADNLHYDPFNQGAGMVNAERATSIASGGEGFYLEPASWSVGDYRGRRYPAFGKLVFPGEQTTSTFEIHNTGETAIEVAISPHHLVKFDQRTLSWATSDVGLEEDYDFNVPNYLLEITELVPDDTDLMVVRLIQPLAEIDADGDYDAESRWRFVPYDWSDDGDGEFWTDLNGDGTVNPDELDPDDAYIRFTYVKNVGTSQEFRIQRPLDRMHDGIWLALQHTDRDEAIPQSHFQVRLEFYRHQAWDWVSVPGSVALPAGGAAEFQATLSMPGNARLGVHEGVLWLDHGSARSTLPISVVAAARLGVEPLVFGGNDSTTPYENGTAGGFFNWTARAYDGDWRFFFVDVPSEHEAGSRLLVRTSWLDVPRTDLDTIVLGPVEDPAHSGAEPEYYGPYRLDDVGRSPNWHYGGGTWGYNTSSEESEDWVSAPLREGLHAILLHNVLYQGSANTFEVPVTVTVGRIEEMAGPIQINAAMPEGTVRFEIGTGMALETIEAEVYGLSCEPWSVGGEVAQDAEYEMALTLNDCGRLAVTLNGEDLDDLDLWLYHPDGYPTLNSTGGSAQESLSMRAPADGTWVIQVEGSEVAGSMADFVLTVDAVQGGDLEIVGLPSGPFAAGDRIPFEIAYSIPPGSSCDVLHGLLIYGPPGGQVVEVPIEVVTRSTRRGTRRITP